MTPPDLDIRIDRYAPGTRPFRGVAHVELADGSGSYTVLLIERNGRFSAVTPTVWVGATMHRSYEVPWWPELRDAVEDAWHDTAAGNEEFA